jgi:cytochrome P450
MATTNDTVDLGKNDRGVLFDADAEALAAGWATDDPYPYLLKLLDGPPVRKGTLEELMGVPQMYPLQLFQGEVYSILSYEAVNAAFMDAETFNNKVYESLSKPTLGDTLLNMDGAHHKSMRNVTKPWFKPSFTNGWWNDKWIVRAVDELFDRITAKDHADLNLELCAPLPMSVVSIGFGIPVGEALSFRQALHVVMSQKDPVLVAEAHAEVERVLHKLMAERREQPEDDLVSRLVHADLKLEDGTTRKLTDDEVMRYCMLIIHAGGGTTWRQMGITIMALLNHPEQMDALRKDRSLLRPAIQEATRWYPTDSAFLRYVARDTVFEGVEMKAGSIAYLCLATANRDRTQWEDPDAFNILRPTKRHFAFGAGVHACLGQHLSRQEMEVALNAVLDQLVDLRWDPDYPPARMSGGTLIGRGPNALQVRFTPVAGSS